MVVAKENDPEVQLLKSKDGKPVILERKRVQYKDYSSKFCEKSTDFSKQFAHMYACRLGELRDVLIERVEAKWDDVPIVKLADLEHQEDKRCVIIGTLYKHQQWKPSILRELSEDNIELPEEHKDDYCDDKDQPYLEDEMLRIKLIGDKVHIGEIITGVVCAILGHKTESGAFDVEDWCFPGCPKKSVRQVSFQSKEKLVMVSTLDVSKNGNSLAMNLFIEWISGMAGNFLSQSDQASVVRLLIAGNSVMATNATDEKDFVINTTDNAESVAIISDSIGKLDDLLDQVLGQCPITLMPGQYDPTNYMLPQKPIHKFMFRKSSRYGNFKCVSNPWIGEIDNRLIVGSSGQPIEDIARVCGSTVKSTPLDWLEKTLNWRHLCPTAPDTLPSHPYYEKDLFIMKQSPDIYFVSNTDKFETKLWKGDDGQVVRLICVPKFSTTCSAVLVDLETLDTETISFGSN